MDQETVYIIMAGCICFVFFEGIKAFKKIGPYHYNAQEVDRIFSMHAFEKEEEVRIKLKEFFGNIERSLMTTNLCFVFVYVMISLMSKMMWQWSWKQSFGSTLIFYMIPLGITYATFNENRLLKKETMDKFKTS